MARRQQSRPPAAPGQRRARTSGRPPSPRIVSGARRYVRDAITDLGNIPILRPQPQQAIIARVDDDSEDSDETVAEPAQHVKSSPDAITIPAQPVQLAPTSSIAAAPPTRHNTRLPFRLGHSRKRLETEEEQSSSPKEQTNDSEGTLVEPAGPPMEASNVAGPATPSRGKPNEESTADSSPTRQPGPSTTSASLRGGAGRPQRNRVRSVGQDALYAPSPLRQTQVPSPTHQQKGDSTYSDEGPPTMYLQGYFEDTGDPEPKRIDSGDITESMEMTGASTYTFRAIVPRAPHTEPFRRTSQPRFHSRSHSSGDAPPSRLFTPTSSAPHISTGHDVFWTATAPATERFADGRTSGRPRQHSSEMSNMSLAYSYYELPENRQSSGEHSTQGSLVQSQYDGAAASRQVSRGTYRSVPLSEAQALGDNVLRPPTPTASSFAPSVPAFPRQSSASPLPAEPYARPFAGSIGAGHQPAIRRRISQDSSDREGLPSAIAAAMENRVSPLEALTAQIGWASRRLGDQQVQHPRSSQFGSGHSAFYDPSPRVSAYGPHQLVYGPSSFGQPSGMLGPLPDAFSPPMAMADDPYTRGVSAHAGRPYASTARPVTSQSVPTADYHVPPYPRNTQGGRSGQRSSENAPVGSSAQAGRTGQRSQVQDQVSAFEQMHNVVQPR